ncbi:hypothetical protein ACIG5E_10335 [Kitasatospora sp. NPDC053057]|uniref:hypothetical protein n=1 Tax=Kitasatospora sp. NPDC053057 TaxID=3364062 RepID=UPI0037C8BE72
MLGSGIELSRAAGFGTPDGLAGVAVCADGQRAGPVFWDEFTRLVEHHRFPSR